MYTLQFGCAHYRPTLSSSQTVLADVEAGTDGGVENDEASNDAEFEQNGTNAIERTDDDSLDAPSTRTGQLLNPYHMTRTKCLEGYLYVW